MGGRKPRNIYLTGFSGTGKSTAGPVVAHRLGFDFVDLDAEIERAAGRPVPEIFKTAGEDAFRRLETEALTRLAARAGLVVATGGGVVLRPENRRLMAESGLVVCLEARPETIARRLAALVPTRPLLAGPDPAARIAGLKEYRQPFYATADWVVQTDLLTPDEVAAEVIRAWEILGPRLNGVEAAADGWPGAGREGLAPYCPDAGATCVVRSSAGDYPVYVGWGNLAELGWRIRSLGLNGRAWVIADRAVWDAWGERLRAGLAAARFECRPLQVEPGEEHKSLAEAERLYGELSRGRAERQDIIVAFGGGVIGDLGGFVAATYLRGLPLVQVPTSLLAMVDAAVGGKVAVNLPVAKNLVGAFYPPRLVLADTELLTTLPAGELTAGWAEVVKHAVILDPDLFEEFCRAGGRAATRLDPETTPALVGRSVAIKARVVSEDEHERTGLRMVLNFGHTVGHALEAVLGYGRIRHGEAVAIGMVAAARLSVAMGLLDKADAGRIEGLLAEFGLPVRLPPGVNPAALVDRIYYDKKVAGGRPRWVLLRRIGETVICSDVPDSLVLEVLNTLRT